MPAVRTGAWGAPRCQPDRGSKPGVAGFVQTQICKWPPPPTWSKQGTRRASTCAASVRTFSPLSGDWHLARFKNSGKNADLLFSTVGNAAEQANGAQGRSRHFRLTGSYPDLRTILNCFCLRFDRQPPYQRNLERLNPGNLEFR